MSFRLYPEEQRWWSFEDYQAVLDVMAERHPSRVLEFGPGSSTLALIEGGAATIDTCEDNPAWAKVYRERLQDRYPLVVRLHTYRWSDPLTVPSLAGKRYDLALIDGPHGTLRRPVVLEYCLARCTAVLMPTEDWDGAPGLRPFISAVAERFGRVVRFMETGRLSGGFALVTHPC